MAETAIVSSFTLTTSIAQCFIQATGSNGTHVVHISNIGGATRLYTIFLRPDATTATSADAVTGVFTTLPVSASHLLPLSLPAGGTVQGVADAGSGVVVLTNGVNVT